jgi:hypothetical protein
LNGGAEMFLNGAVYSPTRTLEYSGGVEGMIACNLLVGNKVEFTGNVETFVSMDEGVCEAFGFGEQSAAAQRIVVLVE